MEHMYERQRLGKYILKVLQFLGGKASRDLIKEAIINDDSIDISEEDVFEPVKSRSGTLYIPFNYDFNFGIIELFVCGLIEKYKRGDDISLTEKGRNTNYNLFPSNENQQLIDKYWDDKKKANKEKNKQTSSDDNLEENDEIIQEEKFDDWKALVLQKIKEFSPQKFESFSRHLLSKMGIRFDPIKGINATRDHGLDGFGYFESDEFRTSRVAIQCKRFNEVTVSEPEIDKFKGVMDTYNADYGVFITTSYFTKQAQEKALLGTRTVTLIDGKKLIDLIQKYEVYLNRVETYSLGDFYYSND